jgi:putative peptidoglycan lipid II flippase
MLLAYLVGQHGANQGSPHHNAPSSQGQGSTGSDATRTLPISAAVSFDPPPQGSGDENPGEVASAIDGSPSTSWDTKTYFNRPDLGGLKDGVGLVLDLGQVRTVTKVEVTLVGTGTDVELRAAPDSASSAPTSSADQYTEVGQVSGAGTDATFTLDAPVQTRYLLIWLTSLPHVGGNHYRGGVADVTVTGS